LSLPVWPVLPARPIALLDHCARVVAGQLDVPIALVSLVGKGGQVSPGAVGLPEPWATRRSVPLSHSLCRHVVERGEPLFVENAVGHPLVSGNGAVTDWGVLAYGGAPLTGPDGAAVGALSAIDRRPRRWLAKETELLVDLAVLCSAQIRLHEAEDAAREERSAAERDALHARAAEATAREAIAGAHRSLQHCRRLERVVDALARVNTVRDITGVVSRLSRDYLGATQSLVGVTCEPATELRLLPLPHSGAGRGDCRTTIPLADDSPLRLAVREQRAIGVPLGTDGTASGRFSSRVDLPLPLPAPHLGVLSLRWSRPRDIGEDVEVLEGLARHTAWAVERALLAEWS
jgi:GAF domain-containing protein